MFINNLKYDERNRKTYRNNMLINVTVIYLFQL